MPMFTCSDTTLNVLCMEIVAIDRACKTSSKMDAEDVFIINKHLKNMRDILMSPYDFKQV